MQIYTVWQNIGFGIDEKCLCNEAGDYIGIRTGTKYYSKDCHHSQQYKAQIVNVDDTNKTGMIHLNADVNKQENRKSWKQRYIGCYVTVEKAHHFGDIQVYRCLELGDYWSANEIKLIE